MVSSTLQVPATSSLSLDTFYWLLYVCAVDLEKQCLGEMEEFLKALVNSKGKVQDYGHTDAWPNHISRTTTKVNSMVSDSQSSP